jgi:hypothetical protein
MIELRETGGAGVIRIGPTLSGVVRQNDACRNNAGRADAAVRLAWTEQGKTLIGWLPRSLACLDAVA